MDEQAKHEAAQQFENNNGMSIEEAYDHVKNWYAEGQYKEVIDGCEEIMKYIPDYEDIEHLFLESKEKLNKAIPTQSTITETQSIHENITKKIDKKEEEIEMVSSSEKFLAAIGYLGFLCILPLLLAKDSEYAKFHGKQGLALAILFFLYRYVSILAFIPFLEWFIRFLVSFGMIIELTVIILAMIQAYRGRKWKMPVIYKMSQAFKF